VAGQLGTYLSTLAPHKLPADTAFGINSAGILVCILFLPVFGHLSDDIGESLGRGCGSNELQ
jgi:hypothetical protein